MNHSLESYLQRQSTQTLELLLQQYEQGSEMDTYIVKLIRKVLNNRQIGKMA